MKRIGLAVFLVFFTAMSVAEAQERKRVAVLDFDFGAVQRNAWWGGRWDVGNGIADLVITQLVQDGTYSVIERRALDAILAEQNFAASDRANPTTAARIGQILGVDAIIIGSVTQFGFEDRELNIGGVGGRLGRFGRGRVGRSEGKAKVAIDARLVHVETGEILAVAQGEAVSSRSGLLLGGFGAGGGGYGGGSIDMGSSNFQETVIGEATHEAVGILSAELVKSSDRLPTRIVEIRGLVAHVANGTLILNVGSQHGVQVGDQLAVHRVTDTIKDPATGQVLRELTQQVGQVRVTEVDGASSVAAVVSGSGFEVGDVVRND